MKDFNFKELIVTILVIMVIAGGLIEKVEAAAFLQG